MTPFIAFRKLKEIIYDWSLAKAVQIRCFFHFVASIQITVTMQLPEERQI